MRAKTAKEALAQGKTRYFTGKPCKHNHVADRSALTRGCITCMARYSHEMRQRRLPEFLEKNRQNQARRKAEIIEYSRRRYVENKAAVRAASEKWRKINLAVDAAKVARRKARRLLACPPWADHGAIEAFYIEARRLTEETGVQHEVDHIHPLQGENFCGLHVHWNLQILTKSENSRKKNRLIEAALSELGPLRPAGSADKYGVPRAEE